MKIIAGKHRGRTLSELPGRDIRPTSARTREALFNIITHNMRREDGTSLLQGARVADLFCGTGAFGLEALSRGASEVTFVDSAANSIALAKKNAGLLHEEDKCTFQRADATKLKATNASYDLIFLDPPYDAHLIVPALENLVSAGWVEKHTHIIAEADKRDKITPPAPLQITDTRLYGNTQILFFRMV